MKRNRKPTEEEAVIRRLSLVSIIGNIFLSGFKLFAGFAGHSGAMLSDAIHSFSDVITTFIAFFGVKMAQKPADKEHPYGHDRIECVAALVLGVILFMTGAGIGKVGIERIIGGDYERLALPGAVALAAAVLSIAVKEAMYWYTRYYARLINSAAFMADAWHHRTDAFSSVGSLLGIGGAMLGLPVLDSVASVAICLFIFKTAWDIMGDAVRKMLDTSCGAEYERTLLDYIIAQETDVCIHLLHSRMFGNRVYIDLEIELDGSRPLRETHAVAERIHVNVERDFPEIKHIMIQVNPVQHNRSAFR
ncbi:MAG: cation diffusion facilitator family transporter [Roseburia sp.]|nr:cation diffusion facilitator family transporter [Roseburia sp.]